MILRAHVQRVGACVDAGQVTGAGEAGQGTGVDGGNQETGGGDDAAKHEDGKANASSENTAGFDFLSNAGLMGTMARQKAPWWPNLMQIATGAMRLRRLSIRRDSHGRNIARPAQVPLPMIRCHKFRAISANRRSGLLHYLAYAIAFIL